MLSSTPEPHPWRDSLSGVGPTGGVRAGTQNVDVRERQNYRIDLDAVGR